jgi:hypothetical protein
MYLLVPTGSDKRVLHPGKVIESNRESFAIQMDTPVTLNAGFETLAYCEVRGKFFQQGATLTESRTDSPVVTTYVFKRTTEPVSAEQRQTFRVSVALSNIRAEIGNQKNCHVVDLSPEGLAAIASPGFSQGSVQKISIVYENQTITADASVQTIKVMPTGKVRYGLLVPASNVTARKALQKISVTFQRTQLKRLAGAA